MRNFKLFLWIFILLILETTLGRYIKIQSILPDIVLVFVISYAILEEAPLRRVVVGCICGIAMGALGGRGPAFMLLWYMYGAYFTGKILSRYRKQWFFKAAPAVFLVTVAGELFYYVFHYFSVSGFLDALLWTVLPAAVYNAAVSLVIFPLLRRTIYKKSTAPKIVLGGV